MAKRITIGIILLIYVILSFIAAQKGGDFDVFLDASIKLFNHQNIYAPPFVKEGFQYYYSPLFALSLLPFSGNFFITELLWLLLSGFFLYRIVVLMLKYLDLSFFTQNEIYLLIVISSFFIIRFLLYNISMIQINIFLLWVIFESIQLIQNKKWILGSAILAYAINIKLLPLVILPYLLYRRHFKATISVIIISMVLLLLPALFIGYEYNFYLHSEWWEIINPENSEHLVEAGIYTQSLVALIPVFLTGTKGDMEINRNILSLSAEMTEMIVNYFRLFLIGITVLFLKSPFKENQDKLIEFRALAYICLLVPLIFPHQNKYAFIFLFPMIIYLTYYCLVMWKYNRTLKFKVYLILLLIVSVEFTPLIGSDIIGRFNYDLTNHFRLLGIASLLLIIFAAIGSPAKINKIGMMAPKKTL